MLISALTVTRPGALPRLEAAFGDLARQTHKDCELVVVHDGDAAFDTGVRRLADRAGLRATVDRAEAGRKLGELRNRSVALARGELLSLIHI